MRTRVLARWSEVLELRDRWDELLRSSSADTIFLTWEWLAAWYQVTGQTRRPRFVVATDRSGRLAGVAPLVLEQHELGGVLPYRLLRVVADQETGSDYADWILRRDVEEEAARAIALALRSHPRLWDCLFMPRMAGWSGATRRIREAAEEVGLHCRQRPHPFGVTHLPATYDAYMKALSGNARSNLRRARKRMRRAGEVVLRRCTRQEEVPALLEALFDLNHRRWRTTGQEGTFRRKPREAEFYRQFAPMALRRGWLRLYGLEVGGRLLAVQAGYAYGGVFHQLQEGFDPDGPSGIGNALRGMVVEACIEEGLRTYDFLGGYSEHKRRWLAEERTGYDLFIARQAPLTTPLVRAGIWPTGRYLRPATSRTPLASSSRR